MSASARREEPRAAVVDEVALVDRLDAERETGSQSGEKTAVLRARPAAGAPPPRAGSRSQRPPRSRPRGQSAEELANGLHRPVDLLVAVRERDEHGLELRRRHVDAARRAGAGRARRSRSVSHAAASSKLRTGPSRAEQRQHRADALDDVRTARGRARDARRAASSSSYTPGRAAGAARRARPPSRAGSRTACRPGRRRPPARAAPSGRRGRRRRRAAARRRRSCRATVRSGRTPKRSCAPPRATRKPVITSSKMSSAPRCVAQRRSASRKPGSGGTTPMFPATGSTMIAASPSP